MGLLYVCSSTDRLQGAMIGVVALFAGFAIEAVVVVTVVLAANLWKVPTCFFITSYIQMCGQLWQQRRKKRSVADEQQVLEDIELHSVTGIHSNIVANDNDDGVHLRAVATTVKAGYTMT